MGLDLASLIEANAAFTPDKPALRFEGQVLSYVQLAARIGRAACALAALGVVAGNRVAILSLNRPDYLVLLYACARLGAILVPINWRLAVAEQRFILADSGANVLAIDAAFIDREQALSDGTQLQLVALESGQSELPDWETLLGHSTQIALPTSDLSLPLLIVYTSGTTGRPKGAVLTQAALVWNGVMSQHMHGLTSDDHVLTVLPFFHVGGLNIQTTPALHHGATVTIHARFTPAATLAAIAQDRPTLTVLVPATIQAVTEDPAWSACDLSRLRAVTTGSTIVPQLHVDVFEARNVPVLQVYGSTETCPIGVYTRLGGDRSRPGSTGLAGLGCEMRIVDGQGASVPPGQAGEILLRGPQLFAGYWNDPVATEAALDNGWYATGDIGTQDGDGYLRVHDRKKNMIISGGENIYPAEIERVLRNHPGIADAAVIGRPDPRWQEVPVAYVVPRPGHELTCEAVIAHVQAELARFKAPREVIFVDDLPRNALGKVQHFRLKDVPASEV